MTKPNFPLSHVAFFVVVSLGEIFGGYLVALQILLLTPSSALGVVSSLILYSGAFFEQFFNIDIGITDTLLVFLLGQMVISLFILCVFFSIVLISPKNTYSLSDCLIAFAVFLIESMPFISGFLFWASFAAYIQFRYKSSFFKVRTE